MAAATAAAVPEIERPEVVDPLLLPQRASEAEAARRPALSPNTRLKTLRDANIPNYSLDPPLRNPDVKTVGLAELA